MFGALGFGGRGNPCEIVWLTGHRQHATLADHCYYDEYDLTIKVNETAYPTGKRGQCTKVVCRDDFVLEVHSCPRYAAICNDC